MPKGLVRDSVAGLLCVSMMATSAAATDYYVDGGAGSGGDGALGNPFNTIQAGLDVAYASDTVVVRGGTYTLTSTLNFPRSGSHGAQITLKAYDGELVVVERHLGSNIRLVETSRSYLTIDGIVFDGHYGTQNGLMRFRSPGAFQTLRNCEIRRHGNHMVRITANDFLMEDCVAHHAINPGGAVDAHCLHSEIGHRHTFRRVESYMASGDIWQGSRDGQWTDIVFDGCDFHMTLADADAASASAYINVGSKITEDLFDTKADRGGGWISGPITIKNCLLRDSRNSRIASNGAACNLKDPCEGFTITGNILTNNSLAFRLRWPSTNYLVTNNLIYDNNVAIRLEDGIWGLSFINNTLYDNDQMVRDDGGAPSVLTFTNNIFAVASSQSSNNWWGTYTYNLFWSVTGGWPSGAGNVIADPQFVAAAAGNLRVLRGSPAIDTGITVAEVVADRDGLARPQGDGYDKGAYEWLTGDLNVDGCVNLPDVLIFADAWGACDGDPNYNADADLNGDNCVNLPDLLILASHWSECVQ